MVARIKSAALMAQKLWPDNAVISGHITYPGTTGPGAKNRFYFQVLAGQLGIAGGTGRAPVLLVCPIVDEPAVADGTLLSRLAFARSSLQSRSLLPSMD
jgi:hypothetical protein